MKLYICIYDHIFIEKNNNLTDILRYFESSSGPCKNRSLVERKEFAKTAASRRFPPTVFIPAQNPPACRRVLWILLVRSCTFCLVFCPCLDFPLSADFCLV